MYSRNLEYSGAGSPLASLKFLLSIPRLLFLSRPSIAKSLTCFFSPSTRVSVAICGLRCFLALKKRWTWVLPSLSSLGSRTRLESSGPLDFLLPSASGVFLPTNSLKRLASDAPTASSSSFKAAASPSQDPSTTASSTGSDLSSAFASAVTSEGGPPFAPGTGPNTVSAAVVPSRSTSLTTKSVYLCLKVPPTPASDSSRRGPTKQRIPTDSSLSLVRVVDVVIVSP